MVTKSKLDAKGIINTVWSSSDLKTAFVSSQARRQILKMIPAKVVAPRINLKFDLIKHAKNTQKSSGQATQHTSKHVKSLSSLVGVRSPAGSIKNGCGCPSQTPFSHQSALHKTKHIHFGMIHYSDEPLSDYVLNVLSQPTAANEKESLSWTSFTDPLLIEREKDFVGNHCISQTLFDTTASSCSYHFST